MAVVNVRPFNLKLPNSSLQDRLGRVTSVLLASALLLFTFPLWAVVCLAIKLDSPGPLLHRQARLLPDGRRFFVLRFRTAVHEPRQAWLPSETRVGQFLRYTRMEDLPQLINVLRGDMALIGTGREPRIFED